jgi:hypothetical protein
VVLVFSESVGSPPKAPQPALRIACELVGDHDPRLDAVLTVEHTMRETLGGYLIAAVLNEDHVHAVIHSLRHPPLTLANVYLGHTAAAVSFRTLERSGAR